MPEGDDGLGQDLDALVGDHFIIGSPAEVVEQILALHGSTGMNHLVASIEWPGMPQSLVLDTMHLIASEVLPALRRAT